MKGFEKSFTAPQHEFNSCSASARLTDGSRMDLRNSLKPFHVILKIIFSSHWHLSGPKEAFYNTHCTVSKYVKTLVSCLCSSEPF